MNIDEILSCIIEFNDNKKKYIEGYIVSQYPDRYLKVFIKDKEITISNNTKCYINEDDFYKISEEGYIEILIKLEGIKEIISIKKKYLRIKNTLSRL